MSAQTKAPRPRTLRQWWEVRRPIEGVDTFELIDMRAMYLLGCESALMLLTDYGRGVSPEGIRDFALELHELQNEMDQTSPERRHRLGRRSARSYDRRPR